MKETLAKVMPHVLAHEGGYVDHKADPGGATKHGITLATLREWRGSSVTKADVKALSVAEATEIYRARYWSAIKGDDLPAGIDYAVLDFAINSGPNRAAKTLQRVLLVVADGKIGPRTLEAAASANPQHVVEALCDARMDYLRGLNTFRTFGKGWTRRVKEVRSVALQMAALTA